MTGFDARPHLGVAADHRGELPLCGLRRRAAERRIGIRHAERLQFSRERQGRVRIGGRTIDDDQIVVRAGRDAVRPMHQRLDLRRAGDAQEHDARI